MTQNVGAGPSPDHTPEAGPEVAPAGARRGGGSVMSMVLSLGVILAIVAVIVLLVPRPSGLPAATVDVASAAAAAEPKLDFEPAVPVGLPADWTARTAQFQRGTDGIPTWQLTYETPDATYAGLQQAADATARWESRQVTDGAEQGTRVMGGREWVDRSRRDRGILSYVLREDGLTTVVTGTVTQADMDRFATAVLDAR